MPFRMIRVDQKSIGHGIQFKWNCIFSGAFATLGFGLFFLLLGNAIGLSVANMIDPAVSGALRFWSWIYMAVTLIFSYYLGAFVATRSNEVGSVASGAVHGVISWGLASVIGVSFVLQALGSNAIGALAGFGPSSANWLAIFIVGLGLVGAMMGGMTGKEAIRYSRVEERKEEVKRAA